MNEIPAGNLEKQHAAGTTLTATHETPNGRISTKKQ